MLDINKLPYKYWAKETMIEYYQRRIIVHSLIYYEFNDSVISDYKFDMMCNELVKLQSEGAEDTNYYYCFYDFDGSTGCHLRARLNAYDFTYLRNIACRVLKLYTEEKQK